MGYAGKQKLIILAVTAIIFAITSTPVLSAGKYIPLEYLPGAGQPNQPVDLQTYSSALLRIGVILAAILAVITITIGGIRYITAGSSLNSTEDAKNMIRQALIGLLVVLFSYLLLYTVNPDILKNGLNLKTIQTTPSAPTQQPTQYQWVQTDDCSKEGMTNYGASFCERATTPPDPEIANKYSCCGTRYSY